MTATKEPLVTQILDFWFGQLDSEGGVAPDKSQQWFTKDPIFDARIKRLFGDYLETASMGALDRWTSSIEGTTALIVMLDQFPRNIFRGNERSFRCDKKALSICLAAIDNGQLWQAPTAYAYTMLMPAMHSEHLDIQNKGVECFSILTEKSEGSAKTMMTNALDYAKRHRDIIEKFQRFPHRNTILGRESTREEEAFLQTPGSSF